MHSIQLAVIRLKVRLAVAFGNCLIKFSITFVTSSVCPWVSVI
jgi:hypothetical protein